MLNVMLAAQMTAGEVAVAVLMGIGVVFAGLVCIIGLCYVMSLIVNKLFDRPKKKTAEASANVAQSAPSTAIANRQEILAAVCAAVAEEEGTDISAIRVISFKKI